MSDPKILSEQGILLFYLENLAAGRGARGIADTVLPTSGLPDIGASDQKLPNVCLLDSSDPSTFMSFLKNRASNKDKNSIVNESILKMSTFEISSLVPNIRIFKIYHDPTTGKEISIEVPFEKRAAGIDDVFKNNAGRGTGAGISSIEWKHNPKFEAAANSFSLNLRLHLQNVEEFFKVRNSTMIDGKLVTVKLLDLMYQTQELRKKTGEGSSIYNSDYFKIKLVVGWTITEQGIQNLRMNSTRNDIDKFISALREQTEIMYLIFTHHDMQFNEDGSIDLQLNYHSMADMIASDTTKTNILNSDDAWLKKISESEQELEKHEARIAEVSAGGKNTEDIVNKMTKESEEKKKNIESLKKVAKRRKYTYFIRRMLEKKYIHFFKYDIEDIKRISQLRSNIDLKDGADQRTVEAANRAVQQARELAGLPAGNTAPKSAHGLDDNVGSLGWKGMSHHGVDTITDTLAGGNEYASFTDVGEIESQKREFSEIDSSGNPISGQDILAKQEELKNLIIEGDFNTKDITQIESGKEKFAFFYLSSLIDVALEGQYNNKVTNPNFLTKELRVILGPITITDYGSLHFDGTVRVRKKSVTDKEGKLVKVYKGAKRTINIGDIPISLKEFTVWFENNIMEKNIEEMSLNDFILSLMNELVVQSLNNDTYSNAPPQKIQVVADNFSVITSDYNEAMFTANLLKYRWIGSGKRTLSPYAGGFRIDVDKMQPLRTKLTDFEKSKEPKNYMIIHSSTEIPEYRISDYLKDNQKGIYHFYYGENRGLIRTMNFSRTDNKFARADRILNSNTGDRIGGIVREKYNVNLEIFGNTAIQAGTYIFVSPTFSGASKIANTEKLFKDIGLGGYYFVTEVVNTIEPGDFNTKIKAVWQSSGDGRGENIHEISGLNSPGDQTPTQFSDVVEIE